ncbi:MAG: hypothetical protein O7C03_07200 [Gammaproteobacteria bacterium]|nr:hypothetical protein [Gammaproteobacteria bacterium]
MNDAENKADRFEQKARAALRSRDELLDEATSSRLAQAREKAMLEMPLGNQRPWLAVAAIAASVVVALAWYRWPQPEVPDMELLESMDLMVAEESIEFYRDLEFLEWAELEEELLLDELDSEQGETTGGMKDEHAQFDRLV